MCTHIQLYVCVMITNVLNDNTFLTLTLTHAFSIKLSFHFPLLIWQQPQVHEKIWIDKGKADKWGWVWDSQESIYGLTRQVLMLPLFIKKYTYMSLLVMDHTHTNHLMLFAGHVAKCLINALSHLIFIIP